MAHSAGGGQCDGRRLARLEPRLRRRQRRLPSALSQCASMCVVFKTVVPGYHVHTERSFTVFMFQSGIMFRCPQDLLTAHWQACSNPTDSSSTVGLPCALLGGPLAPTLFSFRLRRPSWNLLESLRISSNLLKSLKRPSNSISACGSPIGRPDRRTKPRCCAAQTGVRAAIREGKRESCENREREREKRGPWPVSKRTSSIDSWQPIVWRAGGSHLHESGELVAAETVRVDSVRRVL